MKKGIFKNIIFYTLLVCFLVICITLLAKNKFYRHQQTCRGIKVRILEDFKFVKKEDIVNSVKKEYGIFLGQRVDSVKLYKIEEILNKKSAIKTAEAFITKDNILNIEIRQREPVVRFQQKNIGFYADERGYLFPLQENYTSLVPIIDGNIPINYDKNYSGELQNKTERKWLNNIIALIKYMEESGIWAENIGQIHVASNQDLIMLPREGKERFIFGKPNDFEAKFNRIEKYYKNVVSLKDKGYYSTVNVKYRNQIICKK